MSNTAPNSHIVVIPCAAAKADAAAPAAELYASANFAHMLRSAKAHAADTAAQFGTEVTVMILSAEHGLLDLDTVVAPYDTKMGDAGCITPDKLAAQLVARNITTVEALLPSAYFRTMWAAVTEVNDNGADTDPWIDLYEVFEAAPGIGYQRGVAARLAA
jgi:hypothetical protein